MGINVMSAGKLDQGGGMVVLPAAYPDSVVGTWVRTNAGDDLNCFYNSYYNSSEAQNDAINFKLYMAPGTYTLKLIGVQNADKGVATCKVDGVSVGTLDFNGALSYVLGTVSDTISITTAGVKTFQIICATKTGTKYSLNLAAIIIYRTV